MSLEAAIARHQSGDFGGAELLCREILSARPGDSDALHLLGLLALERGQLREAVDALSQSLQRSPAQPVAQLNFGVLCQRLGRTQQALECFERALALHPDFPEALNNRADLLLTFGRAEEAASSLERALALSPGFTMAWNNHGNALRSLGRVQEALASYEQALRLEPQFVRAQINRATALRDLGRLEEALAALVQALRVDPVNAAALFNRGNVLLELGRHDAALRSYEQLLILEPNDADALTLSGICELHLQRPQQALVRLERVTQLRGDRHPDNARIIRAQGDALLALRRIPEALARYEQALRLQPRLPDALFGAASCLLEQHRWAQALERFESLCELEPAYPYAYGYRLHTRLRGCDWRDIELARARLVERINRREAADTPFTFLAVSASATAQLRCAQSFAADRYPTRSGGEQQVRAGHDRIRVAYVSGDLREHTVARLLVGVLERHDRARFELTAISLRPADEAALGQRVNRAFDRFVDVSASSDAEVGTLMRDLQIDIAVDLGGYTQGHRPGIFAQRAAPVQVSYLGYPGTLGANMDYLLADDFVIPEASAHCYSEQIAYLPGCFQPVDDCRSRPEPLARSHVGLPQDALVCCCLNNTYKYNEQMLDAWARILRGAPSAILWLLAEDASTQQNLRREVAARDVDPARLHFGPRTSFEQHVARLGCADLYLDTLPFNAGATAADVLWAGVPLLTCAGEAFAARMAGSLLRAAGLTELITDKLPDYERRAIELLSAPEALRELRTKVKRWAVGSVGETARYCRSLEAAYDQMWRRSLAGQAPASLRIGAAGATA